MGWVTFVSPVAACSIAAAVSIFVSSALVPLTLKGKPACKSEIRGVRVFARERV